MIKDYILNNNKKLITIVLGLITLTWLVFVLLGGFIGIKILSFTSKGKGSVNEYLVKSITEHGGNALQPDKPEIGKKWRYSIDKNGSQIFIFDAEFSDVVDFLGLALGAPDTELSSTELSRALEKGNGVYSVRDKGVLVSYWDEGNFVHLIILRPYKIFNE